MAIARGTGFGRHAPGSVDGDGCVGSSAVVRRSSGGRPATVRRQSGVAEVRFAAAPVNSSPVVARTARRCWLFRAIAPRAAKRDNRSTPQPRSRLFPWRCCLSRKYGQKGYQDSAEKKVFTPSQPATRSKDLTFGPRPIQMPGSHNVSRCAMCGTVLQSSVDVRGQCPKCAAELHSCRQCNFFDPGGRFECAQPVTARIESKTAKNECQFFALRSNLEKETTAGPPKVNTARAAFDALFKK